MVLRSAYAVGSGDLYASDSGGIQSGLRTERTHCGRGRAGRGGRSPRPAKLGQCFTGASPAAFKRALSFGSATRVRWRHSPSVLSSWRVRIP